MQLNGEFFLRADLFQTADGKDAENLDRIGSNGYLTDFLCKNVRQ